MQETWVQSLGQEDLLEDGNPLQYSCLENSKDRGTWWATVRSIAPHTVQLSHSVVSDSLLPYGLLPARLLCP